MIASACQRSEIAAEALVHPPIETLRVPDAMTGTGPPCAPQAETKGDPFPGKAENGRD
jgi:hypothetical protein